MPIRQGFARNLSGCVAASWTHLRKQTSPCLQLIIPNETQTNQRPELPKPYSVIPRRSFKKHLSLHILWHFIHVCVRIFCILHSLLQSPKSKVLCPHWRVTLFASSATRVSGSNRAPSQLFWSFFLLPASWLPAGSAFAPGPVPRMSVQLTITTHSGYNCRSTLPAGCCVLRTFFWGIFVICIQLPPIAGSLRRSQNTII